MEVLRWLWLTPIAFFLLRVVGGQLVEEAVDHGAAPPDFASGLLAGAAVFSAGIYLVGLSGLAFLSFTWALRGRLQQAGEAGPAQAMAFGSGVLWGALYIVAAVLAATAPVLAEHYDDPEGARLVANLLELPTAPLALTVLGVFALGNGLALQRTSLAPSWLGWAGIILGGLLVVTAALQPVAEPTVMRSQEEVSNIVSFLTGLSSFALVPLWAIATGVALFVRDGGGRDLLPQHPSIERRSPRGTGSPSTRPGGDAGDLE